MKQKTIYAYVANNLIGVCDMDASDASLEEVQQGLEKEFDINITQLQKIKTCPAEISDAEMKKIAKKMDSGLKSQGFNHSDLHNYNPPTKDGKYIMDLFLAADINDLTYLCPLKSGGEEQNASRLKAKLGVDIINFKYLGSWPEDKIEEAIAAWNYFLKEKAAGLKN